MLTAIAGKILKKFKKQMDAMVEVLMEKETIDREEVSRIFKSIKKVKINGSGKTLKLA
jgi:ATP-dependent Zn protease